MKIAINKVHFPVTTLGFGSRIGIWVQGCSIRCTGCLSRDTWQPKKESKIAIDELLNSCAHWLSTADGVTISGGEPFDQSPALISLIRGIRSRHAGDVIVYSGYPLEWLQERHRSALKLFDVLISDPFVADAGEELALRGSDNQRVTLLTEFARERYPLHLNSMRWSDHRRLDVVVSRAEVWMAGIPRRGDLERFRVELAHRGFTAHTSDQAAIRA